MSSTPIREDATPASVGLGTAPLEFPKDESALRGKAGDIKAAGIKEGGKVDAAASGIESLKIDPDAQIKAMLMQPPPSLQVGINVLVPAYTAQESRNLGIVQSFLRSFVQASSTEASLRFVAPNAAFVGGSYPDVSTIGEFQRKHQEETLRTLPDMHVVNIDFAVAKGPHVAVQVETAGSNIGIAPKGLKEPTRRAARWPSAQVLTLNDAGLIVRWSLEYDRGALREQFGWPAPELHVGATIIPGIDGRQDVVKLSDAHKALMVAAPVLTPDVKVQHTPQEQINYEAVQKYVRAIFQRPAGQSESQRLDVLASVCDPTVNICWSAAFPDTSAFQHATNHDALVSCMPDMRLMAEDGFAKGELVLYSATTAGTFTRGLPFGQRAPATPNTGFSVLTYLAHVRNGRIRSISCTWQPSLVFGPQGQVGVTFPPVFKAAPYISAGLALTRAGVDLNPPTTRELANEAVVRKYLEIKYNSNQIPTQAQLDKIIDPAAPYVCASFPSSRTAKDDSDVERTKLFPVFSTRRILAQPKLFARNDAVVAQVSFEATHDGVAAPDSNGRLIQPTGKRVKVDCAFVLAVNGSRISAVLQEVDALAALDQVGLSVDPAARLPRKADDELMRRWNAQLELLQAAADNGPKQTPEELAGAARLATYMRTCMNPKIVFSPPAIAPLVAAHTGGSETFHLAGFPLGNHAAFAGIMSRMNLCSPEARMLDKQLSFAKGSQAVYLFACERWHTGADYFGFPANGRGVAFTAILISQLEHGLLKESWGVWAATPAFRDQWGVPMASELVPATYTASAPIPRLNVFDAHVHSEIENRNVRKAIEFARLAFTMAGPDMVRAQRKTHLWTLLGPLVTDNVQLQGGGFGFAGKAREWLAFYSLELLASVPDAHPKDVERVLTRGDSVHIAVGWSGHFNGAPFRGTQPTGQKVSVVLQLDLDFDSTGRIFRIGARGNDEQIAAALGITTGATYGGCFSSPFSGPDSVGETRELPKLTLDLIHLRSSRGGAIVQATFQPGWRWSTHTKPLVKTAFCEHEHFGIHLKGRMHVLMQDGTEVEYGPGQAFYIPAGHDAWVVGEETCVMVDAAGVGPHAVTPITKKIVEQTWKLGQDANAGAGAAPAPKLAEASPPLGLMIKDFDHPDASPSGIPLAKLDIIKFGNRGAIGRVIGQPGWRWSSHVKSLAKTELCESPHVGLLVSGRQAIVMRSGASMELDARDGRPRMFECEPGHDAWVVGDEPITCYDITPMREEHEEACDCNKGVLLAQTFAQPIPEQKYEAAEPQRP